MNFKNALCLALCLTLFTESSSIVFAKTIDINYQKNVVTEEVQAVSNDYKINMLNDERYLEKSISGVINAGWYYENECWYYYNEDGMILTGWLNDSGKLHYFNEKGEMVTGWLNDSGKWYYLQSNGVMAKGWIKLSGKWYYMKENGEMSIGWTKVSNKWYYLQSNGVMATGWIKLGQNWYYLNKNGSMESNTSVDGYILNSTGEWSKKTVRFVEAEKAAKAYVGSSNVGVFCMDLISGESFGINADKIYPTASTAKLSAIAYAQKRLNEGSLTLNTKYRYYDSVNNMKGAYQRGGSGVLQGQLKEGDYVTVERLIKTTCSYSDNLGANLLAYHVSNQSDAKFRSYIKGVLGREIINFTHNLSPKDIALLMQEVYIQGGLALESLKNTSWDNVKIPKYLPVTVAHKIGIHSSANNDVAIVYTNRPYVLAIMTPNYSDNYIANLSKNIYDKLK